MISYFGSITVPGLEHITVFRDDEDSNQFYALPSTPRLARDDKGNLLLDLMIYARDVDKLKPEDLEAQRGWLAASVELQLTAEEHDKIIAYLRTLQDQSAFFFRVFGITAAPPEPKVALPPLFVDGSVTLIVPNPGGTTTALATSKPSLISTNVSTVSGDLSQDSSELIRQAVVKGGLPLTANYQLTFLARIPSIKVTIHGERTAFLTESINKYKAVNTIYHEFSYGWWWDYYWWTLRWSEEYTTTNTSISSFQKEVQSVTLMIDDSEFRDDPESQKAKQEFESMAIKLFSDTVVPNIMKDVSGQLAETKKKLEAAGGDTKDPNKEVLGLSELSATIEGKVDITMEKRSVIRVTKNPNGTLARDLTEDQIKKSIVYLDLSDPFFKELPLRVRANVNFAQDPVYGLKVFVAYDETDDRLSHPVKGSKTMLFTSAEQVQSFRQILARDADGRVKDTYSYWSEIIYKDTGQTIRVPSSGSLQSRDTELVISYRSLGFIKVNLTMEPMPLDVQAVEVAIRYPRSNLPTASQKVTLSQAHPTATFFTYTGHDGEPDPYKYGLTYVLTDGERMSVPEVDERTDTLTISSPFKDTVTTTFVAQADFSQVSTVIIDATYADSANNLMVTHHAELKANGASNAWTIGLRDPHKLDFNYTTTLVFANGSSPPAKTLPGTVGGTVLVGSGAVDALEVTVVSNLDWGAYKSAVVQFEYRDDANSFKKTQTVSLSSTTQDGKFTVPLRDPTKTGYRYRVVLLSADASKNHDFSWQNGSDTLLVIAPPSPSPTPTGPAVGQPSH
jgi:hypothetical protein